MGFGGDGCKELRARIMRVKRILNQPATVAIPDLTPRQMLLPHGALLTIYVFSLSLVLLSIVLSVLLFHAGFVCITMCHLVPLSPQFHYPSDSYLYLIHATHLVIYHHLAFGLIYFPLWSFLFFVSFVSIGILFSGCT